jgi:erythromycin esterase
VPRQPPTFQGTATYDDGTPAPAASITITSLATANEVAVVTTDRDGRFEATLAPGDYALAVAAEHGFSWIETTKVPDLAATLSLSRTCRALAGRVKDSISGTRVEAVRKSKSNGDIFVADVRGDGSFALCLPDAHYRVNLRAPMVSFSRPVEIGAAAEPATSLELSGYADSVIKQPPTEIAPIRSDIGAIVADIVARDARMIGLGEATHGNAELQSTRGALTFELIRRAGLRLVMFEVDAIAAMKLDDYVTGGNVDLAQAVAGLRFWITDTYELHRFLEALRTHNATAREKVRVWGIDVQNTQLPVELLLARSKALKLTAEDQAMLKDLGDKRGAPVREYAPARRAALEALLARLSTARSKLDLDLRIAVAARSLAAQVRHLDGDYLGLYTTRRDAGMAALASYLVAQLAVPRAALWAHAAHVAREPLGDETSMGQHLAAETALRYYPIGFYNYEGSVRAWDAAGNIGVISHPIPRAPDYTVEGALMAAANMPDVAWIPHTALSPALHTWLGTPRYVREAGSAYLDEQDLLTLRGIGTAFDALVVIKSAHDSTPTPTGVRKAEK